MVDFPFVSAMIVTLNEENYIEKCFRSLLEQDYPKDRYELIIIDGLSTDHTVDIIQKIYADYEHEHQGEFVPPISYLENPKYILASGWNIGIKAAKGEYVVRIDGHAYAAPDFIRQSVETMLSIEDAECVGGPITTVSDSDTGELIVEALSSPFGVGGSKFRYQTTPGYVDTVPYGLYRKSIFEKVGYFNEALVRTQDNDLHRRIRAVGGKFYLNPSIKSFYYSRNTIKKLAKQQMLNGKWTMINFRTTPGKMSIRHFVPFFFVVSLFSLLVIGFFHHYFWMLIPAEMLVHLLGGLYFGCKRTKGIGHQVKLPFCFLLIHFMYGIGSIVGLFSHKAK